MQRLKSEPASRIQQNLLIKNKKSDNKDQNTNVSTAAFKLQIQAAKEKGQQQEFIKYSNSQIKLIVQRNIKSSLDQNYTKHSNKKTNIKIENNAIHNQKIATNQLMQHQNNQTIFQQFRSANGNKNNQKLEGWFKKKNQSSSSSTKQIRNAKRTNQKQTIRKGVTLTKASQSHSIQKLKQKKNLKLGTQQFLKQIKLKYAKSLKQKQQKSPEKNQTNNQGEVIMIQDQNSPVYEQNNDSFVRYSQRRTFLQLKSVIPDAQKCIKISKSNIKNLTCPTQQDLSERVNHDSFIPRPQSRSKTRINNYKSNYNLQYAFKQNDDKIRKSARHKTIESFELPSSNHQSNINLTKITKNHYVGYQKLKKSVIKKEQNSRITNNKIIFQQHSNNPISPICHQHSKPLKIKLKFLKSLKYNNYSTIKPIQTQNIENAKIAQNKNHSSRLFREQNNNKSLIKNQNKSAIKISSVPWEDRMSSRGRSQYQRLKNLLKKQEEQQVYLFRNQIQQQNI